MSTFKGVIDEFPNVRVDYFRPRPGAQPALACFLSHVHSDHLEGLESFKSPFIYCSAATKELLLRLERKIHRVMFATGATETRKPQYKKLRNLLKPIPLETPTKIELAPGNEIQVTLFDANHCTGAVMFLFEGNGKAVLYTGDIRSEPWWISNLTRNPFMIEYSTGLKSLDCIYLDTSNTEKIGFPSKAEGLKELLQKVLKYPKDTIFHFSAWTFGYEEIHVDLYKLRLYKALRGEAADPNKDSVAALAHEGPVLTGYTCGNTPIPGCLTEDHTVRLHSCEKGMCRIIDPKNDNIVWIRPIVTRTRDRAEMAEIGVGGGGEDLTRRPELEFDDDVHVQQLLNILEIMEDPTLTEVKKMLYTGLRARKRISLDCIGMNIEEDSLKFPQILRALAQSVKERRSSTIESNESRGSINELPKVITFPYSRHSSYDELCDLVKAFQPRDVYPCTVDEQYWDEANISISSLFGHLCSGKNFRHQVEMDAWCADQGPRHASQQTHTTSNCQLSQPVMLNSPEQSRFIQTSNEPAIVIQRNSLAQLRPFNQDGNEIFPTSETVITVTPPRQITAISPDSESQGLRRKAIHEEFEDGEVKRVRLNSDGYHSSPTTNLEDSNERSQEEAVAEQANTADDPTQESERDLHVSNDDITRGRNPDIHPGEFWAADPENCLSDGRIFDPIDGVFRCEQCGHELWGGPDGHCTGDCPDPPDGYHYFEAGDAEDTEEADELDELPGPVVGLRPTIAADEETEDFLEGERRRSVVGYCLDDESSAYDSQDSAMTTHFLEHYDTEDSFIDDDESSETNADTHASSNDEDLPGDERADYEAMYNDLRNQHINLFDSYGRLHDEFEGFRREVLGSEYSSEVADMDDDMDEDGILVVDVAVPDPVVTELVLSQAREQSQDSEISDDRIRARVEAFEAAEDVSGWHDISLTSTTGNHTFPEIEL
ncbi:hypothetical protein EG329_009372 [Mollisiaceae sp. DMI_Dod_QoI]|nr:hypothetical protein EG329_009372 [Helotiales sp. DMI_Dod_QoI]